jgi:hypothetical protein
MSLFPRCTIASNAHRREIQQGTDGPEPIGLSSTGVLLYHIADTLPVTRTPSSTGVYGLDILTLLPALSTFARAFFCIQFNALSHPPSLLDVLSLSPQRLPRSCFHSLRGEFKLLSTLIIELLLSHHVLISDSSKRLLLGNSVICS